MAAPAPEEESVTAPVADPISQSESESEPEPDEQAVPEFVRPRRTAALPQTVFGDEEDTSLSDGEDDNEYSNFDRAPPFRRRRNIGRILTVAAVLFAAIALGAAAYVWRFGLPAWVPATHSTFAQMEPDLVLDFPPNRQDRRTLPNGTEYFGASGTVTNIGSDDKSVPAILIVMRDSRERIVYSWEVISPKRQLAPGESVSINEAVTDVPKSAVAAEIGWKPT